MKVNMGLGESDKNSRFVPNKGITHSHEDFVPVPENEYDAKEAVAKGKAREEVGIGE